MLTATKQAKTGYWLESLQKNVYSLEEINYFIYNHIDLVYRDFFSTQLFDFLEKELEQPRMAEDLRQIAEDGGTTGDFVRYILNESFYYNSKELADISSLVAGIDTMGKADRLKIQGDSWMRSGNYSSALKCYLEILRYMNAEEASESFYARVAYAVGSIYARMFMCKSANSFFSMAYDLSPDPIYARACIYMSILSGDDEELLAAIVKFKVTDDYLDTIRRRVKATQSEVEAAAETKEFLKRMQDRQAAEEMVAAWKEEYYRMQK